MVKLKKIIKIKIVLVLCVYVCALVRATWGWQRASKKRFSESTKEKKAKNESSKTSDFEFFSIYTSRMVHGVGITKERLIYRWSSGGGTGVAS